MKNHPSPARMAAFKALQNAIDGMPMVERDLLLDDRDQALFQQLYKGICREWGFLQWILDSYSRKKPNDKIRILYAISAYSMLFLDKIPVHANYSEMQKLVFSLKLSSFESKYLTGVLKNTEREKEKWILSRNEKLVSLSKKIYSNDLFELSILNLTPELFRFLVEQMPESVIKSCFYSMRTPLPVCGFSLDSRPTAVVDGIEGIVELKNLEERDENIRVQGLASQKVCQKLANEIINSTSKPIRILEMAAGKGGKCFGTLNRMIKRVDIKKNPQIEWYCADASKKQLEFLKNDLELNKGLFPFVQFSVFNTDFKRRPDFKEKFDIVFLDAPCTGLGTVAKNPDVLLSRSKNIRKSAAILFTLQKELLDIGLSFLKPGGKILYSVCTFTNAETIEIKKILEAKLKKTASWEWTFIPENINGEKYEGFYSVLI